MSEIQSIQEQVQTAAAAGTALCIQGGNSKSFYGRTPHGEILSVKDHQGILDYTPSELVISARAGTRLTELESVLEQEGQMLAFEPAHFGEGATLGGTIACAFSGPRRPYAGAARDFVLGINCVNGTGEWLRFGGQVMKNVAGYDVSRTLAGSLGTLAVLLDIHLRVLPRPESEITLQQACDAAARYPSPLPAMWMDSSLFVSRAWNRACNQPLPSLAVNRWRMQRHSGSNCASNNWRSFPANNPCGA